MSAATIGTMPNQPKTPHMSFRISPELQIAARKANEERRAAGHDETLSDVVRAALERYVRTHRRQAATNPTEVSGE